MNKVVLKGNDSFPFGMLVPNRNYSSPSYRYGFQGQEKDNEIKGIGNSVNYKFRMHDPRVGRFFAIDPLTKKYPHYTPYSFSGNRVIALKEFEGLEETGYTRMLDRIHKDPKKAKIALEDNVKMVKKVINYAFRQGFSHEMPRKLIYAYSYRDGSDYTLRESEMEDLHVDKVGIPDELIDEYLDKGVGSYQLESSFMSTARNNGTLGRFQVIVKGVFTVDSVDEWHFEGKMQFTDTYDFDPKPWGKRASKSAEVQTRIAYYFLPGEGFKVFSEWVDVCQNNCEDSFNWFDDKSSEVIRNRIVPEIGEPEVEKKNAIGGEGNGEQEDEGEDENNGG